jgi:hypothetical protein
MPAFRERAVSACRARPGFAANHPLTLPLIPAASGRLFCWGSGRHWSADEARPLVGTGEHGHTYPGATVP